MKQSLDNLPIVAICGKPNVGKSTLFNRIAGGMKAIVLDEPGITRDSFETVVTYGEKTFRLIDTGGITDQCKDTITQKVQQQVKKVLEKANLIIMVTDARNGLTALDYEVRDTLITLNKPIVLVGNKVDDEKHKTLIPDLYELGLGDPIPISSLHGRGIKELLDTISNWIFPASDVDIDAHEFQKTALKIAIVGKPNVGKSSLVNALLNDERVIVDETPGTTRDAIDIYLTREDKNYILIDTAGMRRKAHLREAVEFYSVNRSLKAIKRSDIILVLIDATEGITDQDKKIIGYALEQGVGIIIGFSKWDLIENDKNRFKELLEQKRKELPHLDFVPVVKLSVIKNTSLFFKKLFESIHEVERFLSFRVSTAEFNRFLLELKSKHPAPTKGGKQAKIYYGSQVSIKPTKFMLSVNQKKLFHFSYLRFIENAIRERYIFTGVPILLQLEEGKEK